MKSPVRDRCDTSEPPRPLADRLRPEHLEDVIGQQHLLNPNGPIGIIRSFEALPSMVLWGPPGSGKTTIARILARDSGQEFTQISAVFSNVAELKSIFKAARTRRESGRCTVLFVDEIHRFNKAQQDGFLPYVENGTVTLVGATTENPSFELNSALLSRLQVLVLNRLSNDELEVLAQRAETLSAKPIPVTEDARQLLLEMAAGDGRALLNLIENLWAGETDQLHDAAALGARFSRRAPVYDKSRDWHYNLISALHKSVRGSDPDAALYWLARMLNAGEDPRYIARRVTRMAVEDIGLADPDALRFCLAAWNAYERIGSPEGDLAIAQAVLLLALSPKSNAAYSAFKSASALAGRTGSEPPPLHILNAPTKLMKEIGYGKGYAYDHDTKHGFSGQNYFPDGMERGNFYSPVERGFERTLKKRLDYFAKLRRASP